MALTCNVIFPLVRLATLLLDTRWSSLGCEAHARWINHLRWMLEGSRKSATTVVASAGCVGVPVAESVPVGSQPVGSDLVFVVVATVDDVEPRMVHRSLDVHAMMGVEDEQFRDKVATLLRDFVPNRSDELPLTLLDAVQCLAVIGTSEWAVATQQDVGDDTDRPHVLSKSDTLAENHFWCDELGLTELEWSQSFFDATS